MKSKKLFYGMSLGCAALLLCGCGNNVTTTEEVKKEEETTQAIQCTINTTIGELDYTLGYNFVYSDSAKELISANYFTQFTYSEDQESDYGSLDYCDNYQDDAGVFTDCVSTNDNRTITTTIGMNLDNLVKSTEEDEDYADFKKSFTPEELKTWVEENYVGLTCTIK